MRAVPHRLPVAGEVPARVGLELRLASRRAEIVRVAIQDETVLGGIRIDRHATDRIGCRTPMPRTLALMRRVIVPGLGAAIMAFMFSHSSNP